MVTKGMWEIDPETRSKLLAIQKENDNLICCDCNAPSPQWASPKFGIFICLTCAGIHRGLGVHISFVRSISMDSFKAAEIERMRLGGNAKWRAFFENHEDTKMRGLRWDDATIAERYSGEAGEEWKELLSAKVEGREYVAGTKKTSGAASPGSTSTAGPTRSGPGTRSMLGGTVTSATENSNPGTIKVDEKYFERLGAENASRPDHIPPSQGGKFVGFGSTPDPPAKNDVMLPGLDELQKDPVAALSKGFGWFTSTVTKTAKTVNNDFIQPTAKQLSESDFAAQARTAAALAAQKAQAGAKTAQQGLSRFVEGSQAGGYQTLPMDEDKRAFWDNFSAAADQRKPTASSIGTSAMGKGGANRGPQGNREDEWDDW